MSRSRPAGRHERQQRTPDRDETPAEKMDRNWNELLQELRVSQTGVQILTGFLLTLPFQQRFTELDDYQRGVFLTAVGLAALATALLIAPVSSHRILFRKHEKDVLVTVSDILAKAGLAVLALAVSAVLLLIFDVVVGRNEGLAVGSGAVVFFVLAWVVLPYVLLSRAKADEPDR